MSLYVCTDVRMFPYVHMCVFECVYRAYIRITRKMRCRQNRGFLGAL